MSHKQTHQPKRDEEKGIKEQISNFPVQSNIKNPDISSLPTHTHTDVPLTSINLGKYRPSKEKLKEKEKPLLKEKELLKSELPTTYIEAEKKFEASSKLVPEQKAEKFLPERERIPFDENKNLSKKEKKKER